MSVKEPLNYLVLSNSMRAALVTWAKSLSLDVAKDNITVNNILTGYFDTDRIQKLNLEKAKKMEIKPSEVRKAMEEMVPMKRIGKPEEYGYLVAFLASTFSVRPPQNPKDLGFRVFSPFALRWCRPFGLKTPASCRTENHDLPVICLQKSV